MIGVSDPEKSLALGSESETDIEESMNAIDEMKFASMITSTDQKTGNGGRR